VGAIEATGTQVLDQILKLMLPRFLSQVCRKTDLYYYVLIAYSASTRSVKRSFISLWHYGFLDSKIVLLERISLTSEVSC